MLLGYDWVGFLPLPKVEGTQELGREVLLLVEFAATNESMSLSFLCARSFARIEAKDEISKGDVSGSIRGTGTRSGSLCNLSPRVCRTDDPWRERINNNLLHVWRRQCPEVRWRRIRDCAIR